ncbi:methyltransferase [Saccharopolyspora taberi]|uniref:Methyltransferase n=1 Tax=Saccharopolyspora taberi TaxID=60895 RepID=A0ABN3VH17_9PSEU
MSADPSVQVADDVMEHLLSTYLLRAALQLGVPDAVADEPLPVAEIARRTDTDPGTLARLLTAMSACGFIQYAGDGRYQHNPVSRELMSTAKGCLLNDVVTDEKLWEAWGNLADGVRTGKSPFATTHGVDFYAYLATRPERLSEFHDGLGAVLEETPELLKHLDLRGVSRIVDVGGGRGYLLRDILVAHPGVRGVLFDLPETLEAAVPELRSGPLADRCEIVAGDARIAMPTGADAYLLSFVLHNWDDDTCVRILSQCAEAGRPGARVIALDMLLDSDEHSSSWQALNDLDMFVRFGGGERHESQFADLFEQAGLAYTGSAPIASALCHVIEAEIRR